MKMKTEIEDYIESSSKAIIRSKDCSEILEKVITEIIKCMRTNNKVVLFGNGGSAADAQHIAAEFIGRFNFNRKSLPAISLTTDTSVITSLSNDFSYNSIFSRQCESLVNNGDVVIGISTSGNSKNVFEGIATSKKLGAITVGLLGKDGGIIKDIVDYSIIPQLDETPKIQEVHRVLTHVMCKIIEEKMCG
jgi:D-sedoheptulose 7-phosphate isomerase